MNLWLIFLTGLTSGGISCFAMQGGLLTGIIANQKKQALEAGSAKVTGAGLAERVKVKHVKSEPEPAKGAKGAETSEGTEAVPDWAAVGLFLITKFVSHVILGFLLGTVGSVFSLSIPVQLFFQFLAALFMLATAGNLLNLHPLFRYVAFQPPKFLQRWVRHTGKSSALFAPALLGVVTLFIPCGVTQAMEVLALTSGSGLQGALILGAFVLGTAPLFATVGIATSRLTNTWRERFLRVAAVLLILMGLWGLNGVLVVMGSPVTLQKIAASATEFGAPPSENGTQPSAQPEDGVQKVQITVSNAGYYPRNIKVKAGVPVELTLTTKESYSCANTFVLKDFGIKTMLKSTDTQTFTFTPTKKGKHTFTCSMGMYTGTLQVE